MVKLDVFLYGGFTCAVFRFLMNTGRCKMTLRVGNVAGCSERDSFGVLRHGAVVSTAFTMHSPLQKLSVLT